MTGGPYPHEWPQHLLGELEPDVRGHRLEVERLEHTRVLPLLDEEHEELGQEPVPGGDPEPTDLVEPQEKTEYEQHPVSQKLLQLLQTPIWESHR